jgi:hypothetical protein
MTKNELARLSQERRKKIKEICAIAGISADEAEELLDNWHEPSVDAEMLKAPTDLRRLLAECHELGRRILNAQDSD